MTSGWVLGTIGVWAGFHVAGLTEWYFGDAESMLLYLGLLGCALAPVAASMNDTESETKDEPEVSHA